jgi:adenine/guanine phosphoribosyltransferase-like PRPP-binding protein
MAARMRKGSVAPAGTSLRVLLATPGHDDEIFECFPSSSLSAQWAQSALVVLLPRGMSVSLLENYFRRQHPDHYRGQIDLLIIKAHRRDAEILMATPDLVASLAGRIGAKSMLLYWDGEHSKFALRPLGGEVELTSDDQTALIDLVRRVEFDRARQRPGATLPEVTDFHYEGPSGDHYNAFLRAGYAFPGVDAMEHASFWLLPYLTPKRLILADSSTILALAHTAARYPVDEGLLTPADCLSVEARESYDEPRAYLAERLRARAALQGAQSAIAIVSVYSSGRSRKVLADACRAAGIECTAIIALFANSDARGKFVKLYELPEPIRRTPRGSCADCLNSRRQKTTVQIDPSTYLLELTAAVDEARIVAGALVKDTREFIEKYNGANVFQVHRTEEEDNRRHHMIYIDVPELMKQRVFRDRIDVGLEPIKEAGVDLVLYPTHKGVEELGRYVTKALDSPPWIACEQGALSSLTGNHKQILHDAKRILVVDDVSITGSRIRRYRHALAGAHVFGDRHSPDVSCFVGVARPPHGTTWLGTREMLTGQGLCWAERIMLPDWRETECPWCDELVLLKRFKRSSEMSPALDRRLARMADVSRGLSRELFLPWNSNEAMAGLTADSWLTEDAWSEAAKQVDIDFRGEEAYRFGESNDFEELGTGSIFGECGEIELFVSVASALERLRHDRHLNEVFTVPVAKVLDPFLYFTGRFYAQAIVASLLRCARRHDLRTTKYEPALRRAVGERLTEFESRMVRPELVFAIARGVLPAPSELGLNEVLEGADVGVRNFLFGAPRAD